MFLMLHTWLHIIYLQIIKRTLRRDLLKTQRPMYSGTMSRHLRLGALGQKRRKEMGKWEHILGQRSFTLQWASERLGWARSACSHAYGTSHTQMHVRVHTQTVKIKSSSHSDQKRSQPEVWLLDKADAVCVCVCVYMHAGVIVYKKSQLIFVCLLSLIFHFVCVCVAIYIAWSVKGQQLCQNSLC